MQDFNYHTHTFRCGHAEPGSDEDYVQAAIEYGYKVLGFSDHAPYRNWPKKTIHMNWEELDDYLTSLRNLKEKYRGIIDIKIGFESEYFPYTLEERRELRSMCDYLILGQHFSDPIGTRCSYFRTNTDEEILEYADMVCAGLDTGLFTYLAHPDVFMFKQKEFTPACQKAAHMIARKAVETNTPLEMNVRGVTRGKISFPQGEAYYYPHLPFWQIAAQYPVKVIMGIDAHAPRDLVDRQSVIDGFKELEPLGLDWIKEPIV